MNETPPPPKRGKCSVCGKTYALNWTTNGKVRKHNRETLGFRYGAGIRCPGSGRLPAQS